uniref:MADS-box domain-containing protein n=1 Tax=Solanum lycopersicum TaxID=4081 RepID=A0A3Q7G1I3_SOLLC|nr:agamous-like MADS-box protein AGL62 [Solanum lycopersicum]
MATRINKGSQRVDMVKMKNARNLQVTFSKRLAGLLKKALELCMLCGAKIIIVAFSPSDNGDFSFGPTSISPSVERFLGRKFPQPNNDVHNQQIVALIEGGICELNTKLRNLEGILEMEINRGPSLGELGR